MTTSHFTPDRSLTARMAAVMFGLGALMVALVVLVSYVAGAAFGYGAGVLVALAGIGIALWQWANSDKVAMRAMNAREVTPAEAPELHAIIDRLCARANMPKPRVGVAMTDVPNAFATGRSPDRSVVCVTTGIQGMLTLDELEGVLAHELSHVAHRDVLVMTVASSAGIVAGMLTQGAQLGAYGLFGRRNDNNSGGMPTWLLVLIVSMVVYAVSFVLLRLLSRYRELAADRAGAYLTGQPEALGSALQKITGGINRTPQQQVAAVSPASALCIAPALRGVDLSTLTATHPSLEQRLAQLAQIRAEMNSASAR